MRKTKRLLKVQIIKYNFNETLTIFNMNRLLSIHPLMHTRFSLRGPSGYFADLFYSKREKQGN